MPWAVTLLRLRAVPLLGAAGVALVRRGVAGTAGWPLGRVACGVLLGSAGRRRGWGAPLGATRFGLLSHLAGNLDSDAEMCF